MRLVYVAVVLLIAASAWASPIVGSSNELVNWNFENSPYDGSPWVIGTSVAIQTADPAHSHGAKCINDTGYSGLWIYQIVDETTNPLWLDNGTRKIVDLVSDIRVMGDHTWSTVDFRLGWWDVNYAEKPIVTTQGGLPVFPTTGFHWSDTVEYHFASAGVWYTVNPFNQILLPEQPRWLVVYVDYNQAPGEAIWVDNVILTSKCVPEPASAMAVLLGLTSLVGLAGIRRK